MIPNWSQMINRVPYSSNQFLGWDFFCRFLQQDSSRTYFYIHFQWSYITKFQRLPFLSVSNKLFFHFVQAFLFFSVSTKDCKRMQRYESRCPWLYSRLTRWLNALEKRLFPRPLLLKINKPQKIFFYFNFSKKNELH